jgi:hypothetical protein
MTLHVRTEIELVVAEQDFNQTLKQTKHKTQKPPGGQEAYCDAYCRGTVSPAFAPAQVLGMH